MEMTQMLDIQELPGHSGREDEPLLVILYASMLGNEILQREQEIVASSVITLAKRGTELMKASSSTTLGALCLAAGSLSRRQTGLDSFLKIGQNAAASDFAPSPIGTSTRSYLTHEAPSITWATALAR
jgi:hypothetical protein